MKITLATAAYTAIISAGSFFSATKWVPELYQFTADNINEAPISAVSELGKLVMGLEVLDTRKDELSGDAISLEVVIKALELKLQDVSIDEQYRKHLQQQLESDKKRLFEIRQRLNQAREYDQRIIAQMQKSYS